MTTQPIRSQKSAVPAPAKAPGPGKPMAKPLSKPAQKPTQKPVTAPASAQKAATPSDGARKRVYHWQVMSAFTSIPASPDEDRLAEIREMNPSKRVLRDAIEELKENGHDVTILERYAVERGFSPYPRPGKTKPQIGSIRKYRVQRNKSTNGFYVRIPVENLNLKLDDIAYASFAPGQIILCGTELDAREALRYDE